MFEHAEMARNDGVKPSSATSDSSQTTQDGDHAHMLRIVTREIYDDARRSIRECTRLRVDLHYSATP